MCDSNRIEIAVVVVVVVVEGSCCYYFGDGSGWLVGLQDSKKIGLASLIWFGVMGIPNEWLVIMIMCSHVYPVCISL